MMRANGNLLDRWRENNTVVPNQQEHRARVRAPNRYYPLFKPLGFSRLVINNIEVPHCVICPRTLSNQTMTDYHLGNHRDRHNEKRVRDGLPPFCADDLHGRVDQFNGGEERVYMQRFFTNKPKAKSSLEIAYDIIMARLPMTVGEVFKALMVKVVRNFDSRNSSIYNTICTSRDTMKRCGVLLADNVERAVIQYIKASPIAAAIQIDLSTAVAGNLQMICFCRIVIDIGGTFIKLDDFFFISDLALYQSAEELMFLLVR